jgi:hypothetical protein
MLDAMCQPLGAAAGAAPVAVRVMLKQNDDLRKDRVVTELAALCHAIVRARPRESPSTLHRIGFVWRFRMGAAGA